jgi:hypothetical protein
LSATARISAVAAGAAVSTTTALVSAILLTGSAVAVMALPERSKTVPAV